MLEKIGLAFVSDRCLVHFIQMFNINAGQIVPPDSNVKLGELQREAEEAIEGNETVGIVVEPPKGEEATTDKVVNDAMENDAETPKIIEESSQLWK